MVVMTCKFSGLEFRKPWRRGVVERKGVYRVNEKGEGRQNGIRIFREHVSNEILHTESFLREDIRNQTDVLAAWFPKVAEEVCLCLRRMCRLVRWQAFWLFVSLIQFYSTAAVWDQLLCATVAVFMKCK